MNIRVKDPLVVRIFLLIVGVSLIVGGAIWDKSTTDHAIAHDPSASVGPQYGALALVGVGALVLLSALLVKKQLGEAAPEAGEGLRQSPVPPSALGSKSVLGEGALRPAGTAGIPDSLRELTALHASGALTDKEFSLAKAKLLDQAH